MSIKEFFAFSVLKHTVIEFLKNRGEFDSLAQKYKKPFRGQILLDENHQIQSGISGPMCKYVGPFSSEPRKPVE